MPAHAPARPPWAGGADVPAELAALLAAVCFASSAIAVKFGARSGSMVLGLVVSLVTGTVAVGILAAATVSNWSVPVRSILLFVVAGFAGPGLARLLQMRGVRDLGASVAVPVSSSTNPLLASIAGVLIFGEVIGLARALALALIIGGIWVCTRGGSANHDHGGSLAPPTATGVKPVFALWLPLAAGAAYAVADMLRKGGLEADTEPVLGAFIGLGAAALIWVVLLFVVPAFREPVRFTPSLNWFCLSGALSGAAQIFSFFALREADLSVVAPILAAQPVVVLIISAVFLRNVEKLRVSTVLGAGTVFLGVAFLALS
jgi:drug/metabolite transporter (DMT)-like permease